MEHTHEADDASRAAERRAWARPVAFGAAGLLAGGLLAGSLSATADESDGASSESDSGNTTTAPPGAGSGDPSQPQRSDEELLTGDTADKVEAAALAEYPGATVVRIETDSDGVYEAHLTTADGQPVTVEIGKDFKVTGTEQMGGHGPGGPGDHGHPGHPGGPGDRSGEAGSAEGSSDA